MDTFLVHIDKYWRGRFWFDQGSQNSKFISPANWNWLNQKSWRKMDLESVRRYLEKGGGEDEDKNASTINGLPLRFFERFIMQDLRVDLIEPGRLICTFKVPQRLLVLTLLLKTHFSISLSLSLSLFIAFTFSSYWVIQRRPISLYDKTRTTLVSVCEKLFKIRPLIAEKIWEQ